MIKLISCVLNRNVSGFIAGIYKARVSINPPWFFFVSCFYNNKSRLSLGSSCRANLYANVGLWTRRIKVARYSFSGSIPPKFEHKLRHHITKIVKNCHHSCIISRWKFVMIRAATTSELSYNEMTLLAILLPAVFLGTENCSYKIFHGSFFSNDGGSPIAALIDIREV